MFRLPSAISDFCRKTPSGRTTCTYLVVIYRQFNPISGSLAPTPPSGLVYCCQKSFLSKVTLTSSSILLFSVAIHDSVMAGLCIPKHLAFSRGTAQAKHTCMCMLNVTAQQHLTSRHLNSNCCQCYVAANMCHDLPSQADINSTEACSRAQAVSGHAT